MKNKIGIINDFATNSPDLLHCKYLQVTIEANGNIGVIPTMYQQILQPIPGIALASMGNLPKNGNLPIETEGIPEIG